MSGILGKLYNAISENEIAAFRDQTRAWVRCTRGEIIRLKKSRALVTPTSSAPSTRGLTRDTNFVSKRSNR